MDEHSNQMPFGEDHYLLKLIAEREPETMTVSIDSTEVFKARFTEQGLETIFDLSIDVNKPRWLMTISLDDDPIPVYSLNLGGVTG